MKRLLFLVVSVILCTALYSQDTYTFDKNHARLGFSIQHFSISNVEGNFKIFDATLKAAKEDFSDAVIEMTADVNSINTDNDMRDKDLRNDKWLDVTKYPAITFKSKSFKKISEKNYKLSGDITIHGKTKPIEFDVTLNGKALNPMSKKYSVGFTINGKLNRLDFDIAANEPPSVVGLEIEVKSNVEFIVNK